MRALLTITDAAEHLGISWGMMRHLVDEGRVATVVLRRRRMVTRASLDALTGASTTETKPERANYAEAANRLMEGLRNDF